MAYVDSDPFGADRDVPVRSEQLGSGVSGIKARDGFLLALLRDPGTFFVVLSDIVIVEYRAAHPL